MIRVSEQIQQAVTARLREWAGEHPEPDQPVIQFRGHAFIPAELVSEVVNTTELGSMFLHSLYTSYLVAGQSSQRDVPLGKRERMAIMAAHLDSHEFVNDVDLTLFLRPIERMILTNRRRG